jgi:hypothetical protein
LNVRSFRTAFTVACAVSLAFAPGHAQVVASPSVPVVQPSNKPRETTRAEYRAHLAALQPLVAACATGRDIQSCTPTAVGPDDLVPVTDAADAPRRLVRYGWLRVLLSKAQDKDDAGKAKHAAVTRASQAWQDVLPPPRTTTQLLDDAQARLTRDLIAASAPQAPLPSHDTQRNVMKQVLDGREFDDLEEPTVKDSAYEKVGGWLNHLLESAMKASARAPWLGRALVWGFLLAVGVGLVWGLLQLERRWRVRLVPEVRGPAPGAASAVPWQLWLDQARHAAAAGLWRQAIHFVYWASISRLESKRLWPADRARTPREYLALVSGDDPRRPALASLTGSFERVWYGGRSAAEADYRRADRLADALISGTAADLNPASLASGVASGADSGVASGMAPGGTARP